jgi:hypothetical protein
VDIQTSNMQQNGNSIGTIILNSGSGVTVSNSAKSFDIISNDNTGGCTSCTGTVDFVSSSSLKLTVNHANESGSGTATLSADE